MDSSAATPDPLQVIDAGQEDVSSNADDNADGRNATNTNAGPGQHSTIKNVPKYQEADQPTNYSLFSNPSNLGIMRDRMFKVEEPIQMSPPDFDAYFKFLDNVWRKEKGDAVQENGDTVEAYSCKLKNAKANAGKQIPDEQRKRKKVERNHQDCEMTMKVIYSNGAIPACTVVPGLQGLKHTHDLDFMDQQKRCTGIMDVARREANKGFLASSTYNKMWEEPEKMRDAGGAYFKISDARNVQIPWRDANRDAAYKVHTGYTGHRGSLGTRDRTSLPAASPTPKKQRVAKVKTEQHPAPTSKAPAAMLHYPDHARIFLEDFMPNYSKTTHRPHVTLTYAQSLDGRISLMPGVQTKISGPETKAMTHYLRSVHDAILIGVRTAVADDPSLNCRLSGAGGYGAAGLIKQPRPIIIDPDGRLQIRPEMNILQAAVQGQGKAPWIVVKPSAMLRPDAVKMLKSYGGEYMQIRTEPNGREISWSNIFKALFREGLRSVMVEGGGLVLSELLKPHHAPLLDSVIVTIAPTFMGKAGTSVSPDSTVDQNGKPMALRLKNVRWQPMGDEDVVMCGSLKTPEPPPNGILSGLEHFANAAPPTSHNGLVAVNGLQQSPATRGP